MFNLIMFNLIYTRVPTIWRCNCCYLSFCRMCLLCVREFTQLARILNIAFRVYVIPGLIIVSDGDKQ